MKNNSALFYTCSLIEYIGREQKLKRSAVVNYLGREAITRIYHYADVFHCEPIAKTADEFIEKCAIPKGNFDNVETCRYTVPDYWTIAEVFERLIEDICGDQESTVINYLMEVYESWIEKYLSDYNTDFYYQSREYIALCYREGEIVE